MDEKNFDRKSLVITIILSLLVVLFTFLSIRPDLLKSNLLHYLPYVITVLPPSIVIFLIIILIRQRNIISNSAIEMSTKKNPNCNNEAKLKIRYSSRELYEDAFKSGDTVLILSIMSQTSIKEIEPLLDIAKLSKTTIEVLTFDPDSPLEIIESIRQHLKEHDEAPQRTAEQIKDAYERWTYLKDRYDNIEVRKYKTIPSIQGIFVQDKYIILELMTYASHPTERAGLIIRKENDPNLFSFIQGKYKQLWSDSKEKK